MGDECKPITRDELEREIATLRDLIQTILSERERALNLQRDEYHRRLNELNQAHERAEKAVLSTVPRGVYDVFVQSMAEWRESINGEIANTKATSVANTKFFSLLLTIVTIIFSGVTIWLSLTKK